MTHQTPSVKKSMTKILQAANISYWFMDESGGVCCGRPSMLTGHTEQAEAIIKSNIAAIRKSHAKLLVTSCPICYKVFKQDYGLDIGIMHHTQYINELLNANKIKVSGLFRQAAYHDPCELSREIRVYDEPRQVLQKMVDLIPSSYEKDNSLCCGGSLANLSISLEKRLEITRDAFIRLTAGNPGTLVTSCPQCKKTFEKAADIPVKDIAEIVCEGMQKSGMLQKTAQMQEARSREGSRNPILTAN